MTGSASTGVGAGTEAEAGFSLAVVLVGAFFALVTGATAVLTATFEDAFFAVLAGVFTALAVRVLALADTDLLVVFAGMRASLNINQRFVK